MPARTGRNLTRQLKKVAYLRKLLAQQALQAQCLRRRDVRRANCGESSSDLIEFPGISRTSEGKGAEAGARAGAEPRLYILGSQLQGCNKLRWRNRRDVSPLNAVEHIGPVGDDVRIGQRGDSSQVL